MLFGEIVDYVYDMCQNVVVNGSKQDSQKQFTMTRGQVETWVNQAYLTFVAHAHLYKRKLTQTTTSGQNDYVIDATALEFISVWYKQGTSNPVRLTRIEDDNQVYCEYSLAGRPQKYQNQYYNASKQRLISVYPAPASNTDSIIMYAVVAPPALSATTDAHIIPATYEPALLAYVLSKAQLYCGIVGTDKSTPAQLYQLYNDQFITLAMECRTRLECFGDSNLQMGSDIDPLPNDPISSI